MKYINVQGKNYPEELLIKIRRQVVDMINKDKGFVATLEAAKAVNHPFFSRKP